MLDQKLSQNTITSARSRLAAGTITAAGLVEESLAAIAAHGVRTNAFTIVDTDGARAKARAVDEERAAGIWRGALHGIPISVKDLIDVAGTVTTAASRVLSDRVADRTATAVTRLEGAGAIIIGRTNLHEFAFGTTSDASAFGAVHHPMDDARSAGGSSGGSAAAVSTRMGLASLGTDTGGSIRMPSAACGVVGLKPGFGEVPTDGVWPLSGSLDHVGPIATSVQDAAWLYAVLVHRPVFAVRDVEAASLRLAHLAGYFDVLDPSVRDAFGRAVRSLTTSGVKIVDTELAGAERIAEAYLNIVLPEAADIHAPFLDSRAADYTQSVHSRLIMGRTTSAVAYLAAQAFREKLRASVDALLEHVDALVMPTMPIIAPPLGADTVALEPGGAEVAVRTAMLKHTQPFNLTGHPAITLPVPVRGLPVGLQLVGRIGDTPRLLDVAAACERVLSQ
jgi:aspartyl-tRNA(Asn)/glutamyl-tRNA(Gln) amidotransferase subunit A